MKQMRGVFYQCKNGNACFEMSHEAYVFLKARTRHLEQVPKGRFLHKDSFLLGTEAACRAMLPEECLSSTSSEPSLKEPQTVSILTAEGSTQDTAS